MARSRRDRPWVADDLQFDLRWIRIQSLAFALKKTIQSRLCHSGQDNRCCIGRSSFSHCEDHFFAEVAAEALYLIEHILQFRTIAFLLLLPPIPELRTLFQAVLEQPVRLANRVGEVRNCC